jgi:CDP-glucose 4,6-dehydratase
MENLVGDNLFSGVYKGKKVFLTGHTGFKGSWMSLWLELMGAEVCGYSLDVPYTPSHCSLLGLKHKSVIDDIRNLEKLKRTMVEFQPDIVFHLAAQPLVRLSYKEPIETFSTNVIGSINVYEAARSCSSVKTIVSITTDKVYQNHEWVWGYRENDRLGGKDPYSASKAAMEIMTESYRHSFFNPDKFGKDHQILLGVVRAGNVIGGGDWAEDRLIPDIIRANLKNETVKIRSPKSIRPWQHVLEPISGYLLLGQQLIERKTQYASAYNFGPVLSEEMTVEEVIIVMKKYWDLISYEIERPKEMLHEAGILKLDCTKSNTELAWKPVWTMEEGLKNTIEWYRAYYENNEIQSVKNLIAYVKTAKDQKLKWTF